MTKRTIWDSVQRNAHALVVFWRSIAGDGVGDWWDRLGPGPLGRAHGTALAWMPGAAREVALIEIILVAAYARQFGAPRAFIDRYQAVAEATWCAERAAFRARRKMDHAS